MPRNGSGTYSVPNTFTPATTIVSADVNENFDDLGDEVSNSVAVDGQSVMTGPLKATNGSAGAPGVTFGADLDTGLFRAAANTLAVAAGGTKVEAWEAGVRTHLVPTAWPPSVDVASAATADVLGAASDFVRVTGTTTITSLGTGANRLKWVRFADALTLTHHATALILPGGADIAAAAGDAMLVQSDASSNARVLLYAGIATQAEAEAGSAGGKLMSPARTQQAIAALAPLPMNWLTGLGLAQAADADHDVTVAVGEARDAANTANMRLGSAITKQIDAAWAAGTNAGGLDTGSVADNTWYYLWLIKRPDTGVVDVLFSASATDPTMPAGYTLKRRLPGAVRTDGAANVRAFTMVEDDTFLFGTVIEDVDSETVTSTELATLTVPPNMVALFRAAQFTGGSAVVFQPTTETSAQASLIAPPGMSLGSDAAGHFVLPVNASSQIRLGALSSANIFIWTLGFRDRRWTQGL